MKVSEQNITGRNLCKILRVRLQMGSQVGDDTETIIYRGGGGGDLNLSQGRCWHLSAETGLEKEGQSSTL